ncbi:MAG: TMEM14 family protein [Rhabdochlamydiaceae bacterium]|jgi:uncharacterized membrane protein (UPF0136 family)
MSFIILVYALAIFGGGIFGFLKAGSLISLMAGLTFGLALFIAFLGFRRKWGPYLALIVTFILDAFFTQKYLKTLQLIPTGMLSLLSLAVLISLALFIRKRVKR